MDVNKISIVVVENIDEIDDIYINNYDTNNTNNTNSNDDNYNTNIIEVNNLPHNINNTFDNIPIDEVSNFGNIYNNNYYYDEYYDYDLECYNYFKSGIHNALFYCCRYNYVKIMEIILSLDKIDIHVQDNKIFRFACKHNRLEILKILHTNSKNKLDNNSYFRTACVNGYFEMAKWIYSFDNNINVESDNNYALRYSLCKNINIDIPKWIYSLHIKNTINIDMYKYEYTPLEELLEILTKFKIINIVHYCCIFGYFEMIKNIWYDNKERDNDFNVNYAFQLACYNGHYLLSKWIYENEKLDITHLNNDFLFSEVCGAGHLNLAKWLYNINLSNITAIDKMKGFKQSCINGYLSTAKWIYSLYYVPIDNIEKQIFGEVCEHGHFRLAKWLYSLGKFNIYYSKINIHYDNCYAIINSIENGFYKQSKWLYSLDNIDIHLYDNKIYHAACESGNVELVSWVYSIDDVDINITNKLFRYSCVNGSIGISKYLYLNHNMSLTINDNYIFKMVCNIGDIRMAKWICDVEENYGLIIKNLESDEILYNSNNDTDSILRETYENYYNDEFGWLDENIEIEPIIKNYLEYYIQQKDWDNVIIKSDCNILKNIEVNLDCCNICYESSNIILNCNHCYCLECIFKWYVKKNTCPYCKQKILLNKCTFIKT